MELYALRDYPDAETRRWCHCQYLVSRRCYGVPGQAAYIACKHAVIGLTRTAAIDYSAKGIRINAVCPGVIRTPMAEELIRRNPDLEKELVRDIPAGRLGKPEEIADAVLWLCSPQAVS